MTGPIAARRMGRRLTAPFERGADTLPLGLSLFTSSQASVDTYDFTDHTARFDAAPQPRYVLATARDIDVDTTVRLDYDEPGAPSGFTVVTVPAGSVAGTSFLLEAPVSATARLTLLTMGTAPFDNRPELCWTLTVLLGNTAKLLWAVGAERDQLRGHAVRTFAQRHLPSAAGLSLDLIGHDLGVPRFPPQPYGFDAETVALYHLGDAAGAVPPVADLTAGFPGRAGFPGELAGTVQLGVAGRYGQAMGFREPGAAVRIRTTAAFDIGAEDGFTVECFVRPDPDADGPVLSRRPAPDGDGPGWVLRVGRFDGLDRNVRFVISDGTTVIDLCAEVSLPTDRFTHLAAGFDRLTGHVSLFVDGVVKDFRFRFPLGAVVTTADLLIGAAGGGFRGVVDEVRISSTARADFSPALGEDDEHYRRRLALFRRWTLPTPANLAAVLNELAGPIGSDPEAEGTLVVDDTNATLVRGTRLVHIRPKVLLPGESIDAAGRRGVAEATVVGSAAEEDTFDPALLLRYDNEDVDFDPPPVRALEPGERPPDPHLVQIGVAQCLDRLFALAGAATAPPGRLLISSAYDPRAADLRATGRAVLLGHSSLPLGRLAALAHRAGFDFVAFRAGAGRVYAATAPGDYFAIELTPAGTGPTDLDVGATATLSLRPAPPVDAFLRWLVVPADGGGRATLTPAGNPGSPHRTASLEATAAGRLIVKVDVVRGRHTVSATRSLRVGLTGLAEGGKITADGTTGVDSSVVDRPEAFFDPAFLADHDDPRVDYGSDAAHKVQPAVAELLDALLAELARRGTGGRLSVSLPSPVTPASRQGRQLLLRHSVLTPSGLAGPAFAVGFGHLEHQGTDLVVTQAPGQLVQVRGPEGIERGAVIELEEGDTVDLTAKPTTAALHDAGVTGQVPGAGPRLGWASGTFDNAAITLTSTTQPTSTLHAGSAGTAWVQAGYLVGGEPTPYTFRVRPRADLDTPATVITKDRFDLIMNILNVLHPVGVEVDTAAIRAHVVELQGDLSQVNPDFTYPKFRVRGPLPRQARGPADG
ncbi:LamG domain-containing protein [Amycolatopsis sp. Hca4]|uniref:LamG domain-containing protein n=1 Tax=Amycolatopsis sp. Hca4 TaxID=2742131 RepID=UPI001590B96D|nr:LamG domain-containing protein [Amycolatopsis sp. Hca4]QKV80426.1 LamG domain-containing protein [Amycolatopsis sp. Hca4]